MANPQLTQVINLRIQGTRQVSNDIRSVTNAIDRLTTAFNRSSNSQKSHQKQTKTSQQGLSNIQAGLVQLSTWLLNANVRINNLFDNMTKRFVESETAVNQLKITMGLAGESASDPMFMARFAEFDRFKSKIDELAMTTEYTKKEVADAFTDLVQSGRKGTEAMAMLHSTLQLATASGGKLDLGKAVNIATLTLGTLGGSVEDVDDNLNMLLKTSQKTKIGFKDLEQVLGGLRASYSKFSETKGVSREAELMALASATRFMGLSGAEAAQKVDQFSRSITGLIATTQVGKLRKQHGKKVAGRFKLNRAMLLEFFGVSKDIGKINEDLGTEFKNLNLAQDEYIKRQFSNFDKTTGKYESKSITQLVTSLTKAYAKVYKQRGGADAKAIAQKALGTESAQFLLSALVKAGQDAGKELDNVSDAFKELVALISENKGELVKAQTDALKTLAKRLELVKSAEDALSNTIFKHDIYANAVLDTYKEMVSSTNLLMKNNKGLASSVSFIGRTMQVLTGIGTTLGFTLTAMATFSIALNHSLNTVKGTVKGLGGTLGAFTTIFLKPTMLVMGQMIGGIALLSLGIIALMRHFSGAKGIGEGFSIVLEKIGRSARAIGGLIQLAFSDLAADKSLVQLTNKFYKLRDSIHELRVKESTEGLYGYEAQNLERQTKELVEINKVLGKTGRKALIEMELVKGGNESIQFLASVGDKIKAIANGFSIIGEAALQPVMLTIGYIFEGLGLVLNLVLSPFTKLAELFGYASDEASVMAGVLRTVGYMLGTILSVYLMSKTWGLFVGVLGGIRNKIASVAQGVGNYSRQLQANKPIQTSLTNDKNVYITVLDRLKLKYLQLTGQTNAHRSALISLRQQTKTNTLVYKDLLQGAGGGLAAFGGLVSMAGMAFENETAQIVGGTMLLAGSFASMLPTIVGVFGKIFSVLKLFKIAMLKTAVLTIIAWSPVILLFGVIAGLIYMITKAKPSKVKPPKIPVEDIQGIDELTRIQLGNRGMGTYLSPATPYAPNAPSAYTAPTQAPYAYPTPMSGTQTVVNNYNIRNQNIKANNPNELATQTQKQSRRGSSLGYNNMSGVNT